MVYSTPKVVAKSARNSNYVAGCPAKSVTECRKCERSG